MHGCRSRREAILRCLNQPADWIEWFVDEVLAHGVGLLLGEDLGEVLVAVVVGERGDDDLATGAGWPACTIGRPRRAGCGRRASAPIGRARRARRRGRRGCCAARRAGRARARGRGRRDGRNTARSARSASGRRGSPPGTSSVRSPRRERRDQVAIDRLIADELAEAALAAADRAGDGVDLAEPLLGGPGQASRAVRQRAGGLA